MTPAPPRIPTIHVRNRVEDIEHLFSRLYPIQNTFHLSQLLVNSV